MKKLILIIMTVLSVFTLMACSFADEKEFDVKNPTRVAFLTLDILDILSDVGFEKTGIKEMGMLFKGQVDYLAEFDHADVTSLGTHRELDYDAIDRLNPELIILGNRTTSFKIELTQLYPDAIIYDATHGISTGSLISTLEKNVKFLSDTFPNIADDLNEKFNVIKDEVTTIKNKVNNVKALVIVLSGTETRTNGINSRYGMLYRDFGFVVASEQYNSSDAHGEIISYEAILQINPATIFIMDRSSAVGEENGLDYSSFVNNQLVKETNASKNNNIFLLDGNAWYLTTGGFTSARQMIIDVNVFLK